MTEEGPPLADRMAGVEMRCARIEEMMLSGEPTSKQTHEFLITLAIKVRQLAVQAGSLELAEAIKTALTAYQHPTRKELSK